MILIVWHFGHKMKFLLQSKLIVYRIVVKLLAAFSSMISITDWLSRAREDCFLEVKRGVEFNFPPRRGDE
jgi:hypothetical protein